MEMLVDVDVAVVEVEMEMRTHYITLPSALGCHLFLPQELYLARVRCSGGNRFAFVPKLINKRYKSKDEERRTKVNAWALRRRGRGR